MASAATPELAAAVGEAGGLGALGSAMLPVDELRRQAERVRELTKRPFQLNFFCHERAEIGPGTAARARERFAAVYAELGLGDPPEPGIPEIRFDELRLGALLEIRPATVSFHFGLPEAEQLAAIRAAGIAVLASATTASEAQALEAAGVDAVVAQGAEAGGHRGSFLVDGRRRPGWNARAGSADRGCGHPAGNRRRWNRRCPAAGRCACARRRGGSDRHGFSRLPGKRDLGPVAPGAQRRERGVDDHHAGVLRTAGPRVCQPGYAGARRGAPIPGADVPHRAAAGGRRIRSAVCRTKRRTRASASRRRACPRARRRGGGAARPPRRGGAGLTMEIVLARHGETEWSRDGRHTGRTDIPLTEQRPPRGRAAAAASLSEWSFGRVLSSPLERALETCRLAGLGDSAETTADLLEWDYGEYEGITTRRDPRVAPGLVPVARRLPGRGAAARTSARVDRSRDRRDRGRRPATSALFAHGHMLRVVAARWIGLGPEAGALLGPEHGDALGARLRARDARGQALELAGSRRGMTAPSSATSGHEQAQQPGELASPAKADERQRDADQLNRYRDPRSCRGEADHAPARRPRRRSRTRRPSSAITSRVVVTITASIDWRPLSCQ